MSVSKSGGALTAGLCLVAATAAHGESAPVKPYLLVLVDTSSSMTSPTGFGPPACGGVDTRLDHIKCELHGFAASYGDAVLGLARFRATTTDTNCADGCALTGIDCNACLRVEHLERDAAAFEAALQWFAHRDGGRELA